MFINELEEENILSLEIKSIDGIGKPLLYHCKIVYTGEKERCVYVEPIRHDGKVISFDDGKVFIQAYLVIDNKPMFWRGCSIKYVDYKGEKYHCIICWERGVALNRRKRFRVTVDEYCNVNTGKAMVAAFMKNVSSIGFCFSVGKYDGAAVDYVKADFHDQSTDMDIHLEGKVVRYEQDEEGRATFAVETMPTPAVERYVAARQRSTIQITEKPKQ